MNDTFRILSLSGGGVRGIFQAAILRELQSTLGKDFYNSFDLIAGTSTGSIVGMSIALGVDMKQVVQFYRDRARTVFSSRMLGSIRRGPRYPQKPLLDSLSALFGEKTLGDASPIIVTASSLERSEHRVFSNLQQIGSGDSGLSAVDVVLASAAAPTYFPPVKPKGQERSYLDGGLWGNSPSLLAVLAAHRHLGIPLENIRLISVGTGFFPDGRTFDEVHELRPLSRDSVTTVLELMWGAQASFADEYARSLLGDDHFVKCDVPLKKALPLDDVESALKALPALAETEYRRSMPQILAACAPTRPNLLNAIRTSPKRSTSETATLDSAGLIAAFPARSISIRSEYDLRLEVAHDQADVIGFGLSSLREDHINDFARWKLHVPFRILLLDPEFPSGELSVADQRDREERNPVGTIRSQIHKFIEEAAGIIDSRFHIRLYRCLPLVNMFRIDDDILWGPFVMAEQSRNTPTFVCRKGGFLFSSMVAHFDEIWESESLSRTVPPEWLQTANLGRQIK